MSKIFVPSYVVERFVIIKVLKFKKEVSVKVRKNIVIVPEMPYYFDYTSVTDFTSYMGLPDIPLDKFNEMYGKFVTKIGGFDVQCAYKALASVVNWWIVQTGADKVWDKLNTQKDAFMLPYDFFDMSKEEDADTAVSYIKVFVKKSTIPVLNFDSDVFRTDYLKECESDYYTMYFRRQKFIKGYYPEDDCKWEFWKTENLRKSSFYVCMNRLIIKSNAVNPYSDTITKGELF